jgi:hypothetical protein
MLSRSLDFDPIFIGGEGRSGTTLMRVILDSHSGIACGPESHFIADRRLREFHHQFRRRWQHRAETFGYSQHDLDILFVDFVRGWTETYMQRKGKRRWADKTPRNIHALPYIWELFPTAKVIHMIRDGRDVACSIMPQSWGPNTIGAAARRWVKCIRAGIVHRDKPQRYLEVRYEDLVRQPERETRRVAAFIDEPWESALLDFRRLPHDLAVRAEATTKQELMRPPHTSSIGRWRRELSAYAVWRYRRIAGETLQLLGYEV